MSFEESFIDRNLNNCEYHRNRILYLIVVRVCICINVIYFFFLRYIYGLEVRRELLYWYLFYRTVKRLVSCLGYNKELVVFSRFRTRRYCVEYLYHCIRERNIVLFYSWLQNKTVGFLGFCCVFFLILVDLLWYIHVVDLLS